VIQYTIRDHLEDHKKERSVTKVHTDNEETAETNKFTTSSLVYYSE